MAGSTSAAATAQSSSQGTTAAAAPTLTSIVVETDGLTISQPGLCQQLQAVGLYSDGHVRDVTSLATWTVDPTVATIDTQACAWPVAAGTTAIQATVGSATASGTLIVASGVAPGSPSTLAAAILALPAPSGLVLNPGVRNLVDPGAQQQLVVLATWANGVTADVTTQAAFTLSDPTVASVDAGGLAVATGTGTITLTASWQGVTATSQLAFDPAAPLANGDAPSVLGAGGVVSTGNAGSVGTSVSGITASTTATSASATPGPSFSGTVDPLFYSTLACSTCHLTLGNQFKLFTDEGKDYNQIMNNGLVDTTNPAGSLLLMMSTNATGTHPGGQALDPSSAAYQTILAWIQGGAAP